MINEEIEKATKHNKKKNKFLPGFIFIVVCGAIGIIIGILFKSYLKEFMDIYIKSDNIFVESIRFYGFILLFFTGYMIHIIVHEAGHLVFGLITGYSFVSFRIGSFTIIKEKRKVSYKKFNIPGTAGQCLMMPPKMKDGKYPFIMYNYGGGIMNLIVAVVGILIAVLIEGVPMLLSAILILISAGGIFAALTNIIPLKIGGAANDGYNVISMLKDENAKKGFYLQLRVNGLQSQGIRIKDMSLEELKISEGTDLINPLNSAIKLIEYNWYLDNMDFQKARQCIEGFMIYMDKLIPIYRNEINCELMFLELIGDCNKEFIDGIYDKNLKKYIKAAKFMIGKKRILMAYEVFYNNDKEKAINYYEDARRLAMKYPIKGEADMELMLVNWIKETMNI
jgi:hypothetical protein